MVEGTGSGFVAGKRMAGSGNRDERNSADLNSPQTRAVHMQEASNADPGVAVADESFNATKRLHQEPQWHGWKFGVEIIQHYYQLVARIHGIDDQRHLRFETVEKSPHPGAQRVDAVSDGLGFRDD